MRRSPRSAERLPSETGFFLAEILIPLLTETAKPAMPTSTGASIHTTARLQQPTLLSLMRRAILMLPTLRAYPILLTAIIRLVPRKRLSMPLKKDRPLRAQQDPQDL